MRYDCDVFWQGKGVIAFSPVDRVSLVSTEWIGPKWTRWTQWKWIIGSITVPGEDIRVMGKGEGDQVRMWGKVLGLREDSRAELIVAGQDPKRLRPAAGCTLLNRRSTPDIGMPHASIRPG